jgi:ABC-2 type transport system permease protein
MNLYGMYTLYLKETKRFLKVYHQTVFTPLISSLILLSVFVLASEGHQRNIKNIAFADFIGYGLIIMSITQNAFANSSSSLIMSKVIGYISDLLIPPLQGFEVVAAYMLASLTRGLLVGGVVTLALVPFISFRLHSLGLLCFFLVSSGCLLGLLGILTGIMADSFDQNSAITNYIVNPLSFLSGTFYSVEQLPYFFKVINYFNPFFYMIDGFRYSLIGSGDSNIYIGSAVLFSTNVVLFLVLKRLIDTGWRLKN